MSAAVRIVRGDKGEAKRVLINGVPVPGLLKVQTSGGPRIASSVTFTIFADSITHEEEPSDGN